MAGAIQSSIHPKPGSVSLRILIVEDNDVDAMVAKAAVEKAAPGSCEIVHATTLAGGLSAVHARDADIVLLDLNLPDSRGASTLKRMRGATASSIIVVTAADAPELDEELLGSGAFEVLHKGRVGQDALLRLLRLAADRCGTQQSLRIAEQTLKSTESRLKLALAASRVSTWDYDLSSGEVMLSEAWAEILGAPPGETRAAFDELVGLVHPDDLPALRSTLRKVVKGLQDSYTVEHRVRRRNGEWCWIVSRGKVVARDARGRVTRMVGSNLDISERKRAEDRLRESEARFRSLIELSSDWYWEQDAELRFTYVSPGFDARGDVDSARILGRRRWELEDVVPASVTWPEHRADLEARRPFRAFEEIRIGKDGTRQHILSSGTPVFDEAGKFAGYHGVSSNVTARKSAETRLSYLAQFDPATGLPNRNMVKEKLGLAILQSRRRGRGAGVLCIDLDGFKLINDTLGYQIGDELLSVVGKSLRDCVRTDDTVGRISGDEFAVVIADLARPEDAGAVAQKILGSFGTPFDVDGKEIYLTASIGVAAFPNDGDDPDALLKCADVAMYRAKDSGRNTARFYTAAMNARSMARLQLNTDLRHAVERREFELYYQPKVDLATGGLIGVEALLRWRHPQRGLVGPLEFIPALEESGLIVAVGDWALEQSCRQLSDWTREGLVPIPIAVNLSPRQFGRRDLDSAIHGIVGAHGLPPGLLEVEITESSLMQDPADAIRQLQALRNAGLNIAVDDFGTGYSSLSYLTRLPISTLKIDRSFVSAATLEPSSAAIVRMVIDMAKDLGLNVVAEGVETGAHVDFLKRYGCAQGQGHFFGKPMPAAAIGAMLERRA